MENNSTIRAVYSGVENYRIAIDSSMNQNGGDYDEWGKVYYFVVKVPDGYNGETRLIDFKYTDLCSSFEGDYTSNGSYSTIRATLPIVAIVRGDVVYLSDDFGYSLYYRSDNYLDVEEPYYVAFTFKD